MFRAILERLSRKRLIKRKLPRNFNYTRLYVSPDSQLKYLKIGKDAFDKKLLEIASEFIRPNFVVWDIGANVGVFTFASASLAVNGSVLAVEADLWLSQVIRKSMGIRGNSKLNIQVLSSAIWNENGTAVFNIAKRGRASNALELAGGQSQMGGIREKVIVPTLTLDTLLNTCPNPDFVKIDVEGAELETLQGAKQILAYVKPIIYIEVGKDVDAISNLLKSNNYRLFSDTSIENRKELIKCEFNTLAIPETKIK